MADRVGRKGRSRCSTLAAFIRCDAGGTAIEYALIASLTAVAAIAAMTNLGSGTSSGWGGVANKVSDAML